jgi:uncharacterized membrane protein YvbJ
MALINCPECKREISSMAVSCPYCGMPISSDQKTKTTEEPITTIQETSKKLKKQIIYATILILISIPLFIIAVSDNISSLGLISILLFFAGAVWYLVIKTMIWWHHK